MGKTLQENERLDEILRKYKDKTGSLIAVLQETQESYGFLSREVMSKISKALSIPFSEVYGVATFYAQFRLKPQGKHVVKVCSGTACHVRGGKTVLETIEELLGIKSGETTDDLLFTIEQVACLGACGLAPVMMVDDESFGRLDKIKVKEILSNYQP